jgi:hypothetical protein
MSAAPTTIRPLAVAMVLAVGALWPAMAQTGQQGPDAQVASDGTLQDYHGAPIIMQGLKQTENRPSEETKAAAPAKRPRQTPRGSGGYIPPPVPSPSGPNSPPPAVLLQPPPQPYKPPPIKSFSDRVIDCTHSYPLNKGIRNNPTDQQMYIRQCAN